MTVSCAFLFFFEEKDNHHLSKESLGASDVPTECVNSCPDSLLFPHSDVKQSEYDRGKELRSIRNVNTDFALNVVFVLLYLDIAHWRSAQKISRKNLMSYDFSDRQVNPALDKQQI